MDLPARWAWTVRAEFFDLEFLGVVEPEAARAALGPQLPKGFELLDVAQIDAKAPSLQESISQQHYRVRLAGDVGGLTDRVAAFHAAASLPDRAPEPARRAQQLPRATAAVRPGRRPWT